MRLQLVLTVDYDQAEGLEDYLINCLWDMVNSAVANGALTGDTDAEVAGWETKATRLDSPKQEP